MLYKVDKYKVQTEFAERLVEKSRQLELETQVTRLGEKSRQLELETQVTRLLAKIMTARARNPGS